MRESSQKICSRQSCKSGLDFVENVHGFFIEKVSKIQDGLVQKKIWCKKIRLNFTYKIKKVAEENITYYKAVPVV